MSDTDGSCCLCGNGAKYRCPSCDRQTCTLKCVKEHKERFKCEMTTESFKRDIALLDETARVIESTSRAFLQRQLEATLTASKRVRTGALRKCCAERNIQLLSCPPMLSRHLKNYTNIRKNNVSWTVEWYFAELDLVFFEKRSNERTTLSQALERLFARHSSDHLKSKELREYSMLDNVVVLLRDLDSHATDPRYFLCDLEESIRVNLGHTKVLEFPKFNVALKKDLPKYKVIERRKLVLKEEQEENNPEEAPSVTS